MPLRILGLILLYSLATNASDWPQFLGPTRNGVYTGTEIEWPASGPAVVWKKEIGAGFAAPVVAAGKVVIFHRMGPKEIIECLDAASGAKVWSYDYPTNYRDDFGFDEGPRSAAVVDNGGVYTFGAQGVLTALDFATGKLRWTVPTNAQFGVKKGFFGSAGSPLVEGGKVIVNVGGPGAGIIAFDAKTGAVAWKVTNDEASYSSGMVTTIAGARHALFLTRAGVVDLDPANGQVRFSFPFRSRNNASVNAATPVVVGNQVFVSAQYGTGAQLFEIAGSEYHKIWANDESLSNHYSTSVYRDGYLYGFHGRQEYGQALRCIEFRTGKVMWTMDDYGAGTVTLVGDKLLVLRENGELLLAPASPKAFQPSAHAKVLDPPVRAYPAIADGRLYARNAEHTLICLKLSK